MKKVKKVAALTMSVIMAGSLMACGGSSGGDSKETSGSSAKSDTKTKGGNNEIVFWNIGTEDVDKAIYDKAIELYSSTTDSDYTITSVPVQNDTYKEKLVIAMSSGECPDMYTSWSGGPMNEYVDSGYAQPITDLFNDSELPDRLMDASIEQEQNIKMIFTQFHL